MEVRNQGIYSTDLGERYTTAFPIVFNGTMAYGLAVVTPTDSIYNDINEIMNNEKIQSTIYCSSQWLQDL